ncbi:MAG: LPXTG cell wall anchor domain-containing protein [Lactobacillus sp.]|jgi:LPXTG-motif cell wall-anchored protein|nr:LPXTG cell wall anchor domain-containing protein [Lactobacillus sp.]
MSHSTSHSTLPDTSGTNGGTQTSGETAPSTTGAVTVHAAENVKLKNTQLPKTGDQQDHNVGLIGMLVTGMISLLGLARRKRHNDDRD